MGVNEKPQGETGASHTAARKSDQKKPTLYKGTLIPPADSWTPFQWDEPTLGTQTHGEISVFRPEGSSGSHSAGLWRTGPTAPGAASDGSHRIVYSAPLGDEIACVIDGSAVLTVVSTGAKHHVGPGSIICSPKNLEVLWEIEAPYFKKFWCIWDGAKATANPPRDLVISSVSANPADWETFRYDEPKEGQLVAGELIYILNGGSTGTLLCGLHRSGKAIVGDSVDPDGTMTTYYTAPLGDETCLILEGQLDIVETGTGATHSFKAGDMIGMVPGVHIKWIAKGPLMKKLWIATKD